jgi:polar amino acid transport system permease protein
MTRLQVLRRVLAPQAFLVALPPLGNSLIGLLKETSLAFVCSVVDITARAKILAGNNLRFFESYCSAAIIYWVITFIIERLLHVFEARLSVPDAPKENYA